MSGLANIESEIVAAVAALTLEGTPLLAVSKGYWGRSGSERKQVAAAIVRERMPAAYVMVAGRELGKDGAGVGHAAVSVWLAARSERGEDDARVGGTGVLGLFAITEQVALALEGLVVDGDRRLVLFEERPVAGDGAAVIWEQHYQVQREAELTPPTFGGAALAGADSRVHVEVGTLRRAGAEFAFPGVDGVFRRDLGARSRPIVWKGQLRGADDAAMNALEATIDQTLAEAAEQTMVDAFGRSYEGCVLTSYRRRGVRGRDELSGGAVQEFEMEFEQLGT